MLSAIVENCGGSNLRFMGRFLGPGKSFILARDADGRHTVRFDGGEPRPLPDADLNALRHWKRGAHPHIRISGIDEAAKLLDLAEAPAAERAPTAAALNW